MVFDNLWEFASSLPDPEIENKSANTALKASFI